MTGHQRNKCWSKLRAWMSVPGSRHKANWNGGNGGRKESHSISVTRRGMMMAWTNVEPSRLLQEMTALVFRLRRKTLMS